MRPARGDSRPCTSSDCDGTMHFVRETDNEARRPESTATAVTPGGDRPDGMDVQPRARTLLVRRLVAPLGRPSRSDALE